MTGFLTLWIESVALQGLILITALSLLVLFEYARGAGKPHHRVRSTGVLPVWMVRLSVLIQNRCIRPHEMRTRSTTTDFLAGIGIAWCCISAESFAVACFVLAFADPAARLVGQAWGRAHPLLGGKKSMAGTAACLFVAYGVLLASYTLMMPRLPPTMPFTAFFIALIATAAELIPQWPRAPRPGEIISPSDNFWMPLLVGFALDTLHQF
ncbi:MAG: hypothetical protein HY461_03395 [Parcubacteria group bacterium]|nr:hypothetical protein [Parcubacteria group bacterium]